MYWCIQNNIYNEEGFERLIDVLERLGLPYSVHKVVPFVGELDPVPVVPPGPVIVMGSYSMTFYAQRRGWTPGAFFNENFDFVIQREALGDRMLNWDAQICRLVDVPEQPQPFFIRPTADDKRFTGTVMDWPSFIEWRDQVLVGCQIVLDTPVAVSRKKEIWNETRTWIIDRRVVTASGYKFGTIKRYNNQVDERIIRYAEDCAAVWAPDRAFVLDVADTPDGLKIVEIGNLNAAGFYKADVDKLVTALESMF